jgi:hypothetical protein
MPKPYTVKLTFRDRNMPAMFEDCDTMEQAQATSGSWLTRFAGIKCISIDDTVDGFRHVANGAGDYLFSIPLDAI